MTIARILELEKDRNIAGLIQLLEYDPSEPERRRMVRGGAAAALGRIRDARAVPVLLPLVADPSESVRFDVLYALGQIGDSSAVDSLMGALDDPSHLVHCAAAGSLGVIRSQEARPVLREMLADGNGSCRLEAAGALVKIGVDETILVEIEGAEARESWLGGRLGLRKRHFRRLLRQSRDELYLASVRRGQLD